MTKEELSANLYGLRAGLSAISESSDIINGYQKEIEINNEKVEHFTNVYEEACKELKQKSDRLAQAKTDREEALSEIKNLNNEVAEMEKELKGVQKKLVICNVFMVLSWILVGFGGLFILAAIGSGLTALIVGLVSIVLGVTGIVIINKLYAKPEKIKKNNKDRIASANEKLKELNDKVKDSFITETSINALQEKITTDEAINVEYHEYLEKLKGTVAEDNVRIEESISKEAQKSKQIYEGLNSTYSEIVSLSDWENTDLVIFYIESGRADTLKEALQLADKQRQTDQIVKAIGQASDAVCINIRNGAYALGGTIKSSFELLSDQINRQYNSLSLGFGAMSEQTSQMISAISSQNESAKQLISAVELNNSLQEKANRSSDDLLYDLRYNQRFWVK